MVELTHHRHCVVGAVAYAPTGEKVWEEDVKVLPLPDWDLVYISHPGRETEVFAELRKLLVRQIVKVTNERIYFLPE